MNVQDLEEIEQSIAVQCLHQAIIGTNASLDGSIDS
jgi:hypothetical protein